MNAYLVLVLVGFLLTGIGTVGYFQSTVIKETRVHETYTIKDGATGLMLNERFYYDVTKDWKFVLRDKKYPKEKR